VSRRRSVADVLPLSDRQFFTLQSVVTTCSRIVLNDPLFKLRVKYRTLVSIVTNKPALELATLTASSAVHFRLAGLYPRPTVTRMKEKNFTGGLGRAGPTNWIGYRKISRCELRTYDRPTLGSLSPGPRNLNPLRPNIAILMG